MGIRYAKEKLRLAMDCFTSGEGDARHRLADGFKYFLFSLNEDDFLNTGLGKRFKLVKTRIEKNGSMYAQDNKTIIYSTYDNAIRRMRNSTASKLISELMVIYNELNEKNQTEN